MQSQIIVLIGGPNRGKTTIIRKTIDLLTVNNSGRFVSKTEADRYVKSKSTLNKNNELKNATVSIVYNGKLIAITTYGDDAEYLRAFFMKYNGYADILVCAGHPSGRFQMLFDDWKKGGNEFYQILKDTSYLYHQLNIAF